MGTRRLILLAAVPALVVAAASAAEPSPPRNRGQLLFEGSVFYGEHEVYAAGFGVQPTGMRLRRLTAWDSPVGALPAASPDGTRIAWASTDGVVVTDGAGTRSRWITRRNATGVTWSPDGRRLALVSFTPAVSIVSLDGRRLRTLRTPGVRAWRVGWAPSGGTIAFQGDDAKGWELYLVNSDGSSRRQLTHTGGDLDSFDWSPDGRRLVFSVAKLGGGASVWVVRTDGTHRRRIALSRDENASVAWSPDMRRIAYTVGARGIAIATVAGRRVGSITVDATMRPFGKAPRRLEVIDKLDWQGERGGD